MIAENNKPKILFESKDRFSQNALNKIAILSSTHTISEASVEYLFDNPPLNIRKIDFHEIVPIIAPVLQKCFGNPLYIYGRSMAYAVIRTLELVTTGLIEDPLLYAPMLWSRFQEPGNYPVFAYNIIPSFTREEDPMWAYYWNLPKNTLFASFTFKESFKAGQ